MKLIDKFQSLLFDFRLRRAVKAAYATASQPMNVDRPAAEVIDRYYSVLVTVAGGTQSIELALRGFGRAPTAEMFTKAARYLPVKMPSRSDVEICCAVASIKWVLKQPVFTVSLWLEAT